MINTDNIEQLKQLLKKELYPKIVIAKDDLFNRKAIEYGKFDILLSLENPSRKITLKHIDSGLSPFLAALMAKNKIKLGIDFNYIKSLEGKEKGKVLARIRQNIKLCRKKKTGIILINYCDKKNALSFMQSLGASSQQAKNALE